MHSYTIITLSGTFQSSISKNERWLARPKTHPFDDKPCPTPGDLRATLLGKHRLLLSTSPSQLPAKKTKHALNPPSPALGISCRQHLPGLISGHPRRLASSSSHRKNDRPITAVGAYKYILSSTTGRLRLSHRITALNIPAAPGHSSVVPLIISLASPAPTYRSKTGTLARSPIRRTERSCITHFAPVLTKAFPPLRACTKNSWLKLLQKRPYCSRVLL